MSFPFSVKSLLDTYATGLEREFAHDRANTVGASEIGQCIRKTWFAKNEVAQDEGYVDRYGAKLRGILIEEHHIVPGILAALPPQQRAFLMGSEQTTIVDGYISATPDGVVAGLDRDCLAWLGIEDIGSSGCLAVEFKSLDPRADLRGVARSHHTYQVQVQLGLLRAHTKFKPDFGLIVYVDASFLDEVSEFPVQFDPAIYEAAQDRAYQVMTAAEALELSPEGKISGGAECGYCPWASHCAAVVVAGIPKSDGPALGDNAVAELRELRDQERKLDVLIDTFQEEQNALKSQMKEFLRLNGVRRFDGGNWGVSWSQTKGRESVDIKAAEASGLVDLSPWRKVGEPGDRLVVK